MTNSVYCFDVMLQRKAEKSQGFEPTTWLLSIDIFKGTLDRRAHMKLRGSEWQTVWIVFRRDASERGREESRRVTNDCMPLVARPQISHPMTDVSKAKTWNSFDFFLYTSYIDKYRRWRWGAKKYSKFFFYYLSDSKSNTSLLTWVTVYLQSEIIRTTLDWFRWLNSLILLKVRKQIWKNSS